MNAEAIERLARMDGAERLPIGRIGAASV